MKIRSFSFLLLLLFVGTLSAQTTQEKREKRKNLTIKEWNTNATTKTKFLDHITKYNDKGLKVEEIEYANYGNMITFA